MRIYLAGRYSRRAELAGYAAELRALGYEVTSRWLNGSHEGPGRDAAPTIAEQRQWAQEDLADVLAADTLVAFTEAPEQPRRLPGPDDTEKWRALPNSRLSYEVSSFGRVRNGDGEYLSGKKSKGYLRVQPNGRTGPAIPIHQLVAECFLGLPHPNHEVDHVDGHKDNNWVGNLEYVTHEENVRRAASKMRGGPHAGQHNGRAKLTDSDVAEIRSRVRAGESKAAVARDYSVSDTNVGMIARGEHWPVGDEGRSRGARHVEFGLALGTGKRLLVVGYRENIFHVLPAVEYYETWGQARAALVSEADWKGQCE